MAGTWQASVRAVVDETLRDWAVPGLVIAVTRRDGEPEYLIAGTDATGQPLAVDSLFPVASITKLGTALAVLRLVATREMALDEPLQRLLPDAAVTDVVTPRMLLCHTAGLPYDLAAAAAPYDRRLDWPTLGRACLATPVSTSPGTRVIYSNVGFGLLAVTVERVTGKPFREALSELVLAPLGIEAYLGVEPLRAPARLAGDFGGHANTELEPYNTAFWRSLALPWGGLVTTAAGALALVRAFAGAPAGFLPPALLTEASQDQTHGLPGGFPDLLEWPHAAWGLGVELRGEKTPHWTPANASPASYGHVGASGCLAWVDPVSGVAWAVLGCRSFQGWWERWPAIGAAVLDAAV